MKNNKLHKTFAFFIHRVIVSLLMSACSISISFAEEASVKQTDPYEKINRAVFSFNDKVDTYLLKPIATFYNKILPKPLNQGIHNFFNNIDELPIIANDLLQFHFYQSANDLWRLGINSTLGIGGLFDVATRMKLPRYSNDFGMTLATWGYHNSTYVVWPFFGPSTLRDGISIPVDYFVFSIYPYIDPQAKRYAVYSLSVVDKRAYLLKFQPVFEEAAVDRYVFMRNAYLQRRTFQIEQNQQRGYKYQISSNSDEPIMSTQDEQKNITYGSEAAADSSQQSKAQGAANSKKIHRNKVM